MCAVRAVVLEEGSRSGKAWTSGGHQKIRSVGTGSPGVGWGLEQEYERIRAELCRASPSPSVEWRGGVPGDWAATWEANVVTQGRRQR